jgi:hypothetical protein
MRKKQPRPPKYCEECGKQLRKNYRPMDVVCSKPKWNGTSYSKCQRDRLIRLGLYGNMAQDTTGRKCKICEKEIENITNANQTVCKRPLYLRKYFKDFRTKCEKKNQKQNGDNWAKIHRKTKAERRKDREFFIGKEDIDMLNYPPLKVPKNDRTMRRCLGILTHDDELGEHWFESSGPENRICNKCKIAIRDRLSSNTKYE